MCDLSTKYHNIHAAAGGTCANDRPVRGPGVSGIHFYGTLSLALVGSCQGSVGAGRIFLPTQGCEATTRGRATQTIFSLIKSSANPDLKG